MLEASRQLSLAGEVTVIAPQGAGDAAPANARVLEVALRPLWRLLAELSWLGVHNARRWPADLILASSGLIAPAAQLSAWHGHCPYAVFIHGLDVVYPHPAYQRLFLPAIRRADKIIANSHYTADLAVAKGVNPERIEILNPGVQCAIPDASDSAVQAFRRQHRLQGTVLLSVGRLTRRKGLIEFINNIFPAVLEMLPNCVLVIVGDDPSDALGQQMARPAIEHAARQLGILPHVRFLGRISDEQLDLAWKSADLHIFPIQDIPGDVEGFGMVALEAAAHGLWTIAFASGGVADAIAEGRSGRLVRPNDYRQFSMAIADAIGQDEEKRTKQSTHHASHFDWIKYGQRLRDICTNI